MSGIQCDQNQCRKNIGHKCESDKPCVHSAFPGNVMGGRGVCRHCGEAVNNVAYHESNACKRRPNTAGAL